MSDVPLIQVFTVIDSITGRVLDVRMISAGLEPPIVPEGFAVIAGVRLDRNLDHVEVPLAEPPVIVHATAEQEAVFVAGPPDDGYEWDPTTFTWMDMRSTAHRVEIAKRTRIGLIKAEALIRMGTTFAALGDPDMVLIFREVWMSVVPAARSATPALQHAIDVYTAAAAAITAVKAATTVAGVLAVVVVWPA